MARSPFTAFFAPLAALLGGCVGILGGDTIGSGPGPSATDPTAPPASVLAALPPVSARRLSKVELTNTIRDLVGGVLPAERDAVIAAIAAVTSRYPDDVLVGLPSDKHGGFRRLDQAVQQAHADASYAIAGALGQELTRTPARVAAVVGACATDADRTNDAACVAAFVRRFGERALRRPVTDEDVAFYGRPIASEPLSPEALADVIGLVLAAPDVLYRLEIGTKPGDKESPLSPYELATRLSYHFWETIPDDELLETARNGSLANDDVYTKQVARLFADPRAKHALESFYDEWLRLHELPRLDSRLGDPVFEAFVAGNRPTPELHERMIQETLDAASWVTGQGGSLKSLVTNRQSFAKTADLATIYGVTPWNGTATPPTFSDSRRAGLVTRAAFVANDSANTRPIMKGVRIRMGLLCDTIPPPPPNAAATVVSLSTSLTTREVVEQLTEQPGSACSGCHTSVINPLGFATEAFDALARPRTKQRLFDPSGALVTERDVDTRSVPRIIGTDSSASAGPEDLVRLLAESGRIETCFVRNYFRFTLGRIEAAADEPAIASLADAARGGQGIADVMRAMALRREFRVKATP